MGLDMYLRRNIRRYRKPDGTLSGNMNDVVFDGFGRSNAVTTTDMAAYWRKANQIHRWFVEEVAGGEDDCREVDVGIDTLKKLRRRCMTLLKLLSGTVLDIAPEDRGMFDKVVAARRASGDNVPDRVVTIGDDMSWTDGLCWLHRLPEGAQKICEDELPTTPGFFFGSTAYNGSYLEDIVTTVKMLDEVLAEHKRLAKEGSEPYYTYQASW